jgi:hypothetical protein
MGTSYLFKCNKCSYEAELSDGKDYGFVAVIETMKCNDCEEMVEVLIGARGEEGKTGDPEMDKILGLCPKCKGSNVAKWDQRRSCPKCDGKMQKGKETMLWD